MRRARCRRCKRPWIQAAIRRRPCSRSSRSRNAPQTLERALKLDPKYATAHYLMGNMLAGDKAFDKARKHYQDYLKLEPNGEQAARAKERLEQLKKMK
jgi:tetratricopeptide (TPR) repeat protein